MKIVLLWKNIYISVQNVFLTVNYGQISLKNTLKTLCLFSLLSKIASLVTKWLCRQVWLLAAFQKLRNVFLLFGTLLMLSMSTMSLLCSPLLRKLGLIIQDSTHRLPSGKFFCLSACHSLPYPPPVLLQHLSKEWFRI